MLEFKIKYISLLCGFIAVPSVHFTQDSFKFEVIKFNCQRSTDEKQCPFQLSYKRSISSATIETNTSFALESFSCVHNHPLVLTQEYRKDEDDESKVVFETSKELKRDY